MRQTLLLALMTLSVLGRAAEGPVCIGDNCTQEPPSNDILNALQPHGQSQSQTDTPVKKRTDPTAKEETKSSAMGHCGKPTDSASGCEQPKREIGNATFKKVRPVVSGDAAPKRYLPCEAGGTVSQAQTMKELPRDRVVYAKIQVLDAKERSWKLAGDRAEGTQECSFVYIDKGGTPLSLLDPKTWDNKESRVFGSMLGYSGENAKRQYILYPNGLVMAVPCLSNQAKIWAEGESPEGKLLVHQFELKNGEIDHSLVTHPSER